MDHISDSNDASSSKDDSTSMIMPVEIVGGGLASKHERGRPFELAQADLKRKSRSTSESSGSIQVMIPSRHSTELSKSELAHEIVDSIQKQHIQGREGPLYDILLKSGKSIRVSISRFLVPSSALFCVTSLLNNSS